MFFVVFDDDMVYEPGGHHINEELFPSLQLAIEFGKKLTDYRGSKYENFSIYEIKQSKLEWCDVD